MSGVLSRNASICPSLLALAAAMLLSACASTAPGGRAQMTVPEPISALYSSIDLNVTLASQPAITSVCEGIQCLVDKGFERQVARLGSRLAEAAYDNYPDLRERIPKFRFVVAEKAEGGSSSDASGTIVIYRGVRQAKLDEDVLAYLIAYEMGRVIARHHDEKSAATVVSSVLAQILLGPVGLARGVAFIASSTATALGTKFMTTGTRREKLQEADLIALDLLARQGWDEAEVAESMLSYSYSLDDTAWSHEVRRTAARLVNLDVRVS